MSQRGELSSKALATLASRVLRQRGKCTPGEAMALAGSVLTQTENKSAELLARLLDGGPKAR